MFDSRRGFLHSAAAAAAGLAGAAAARANQGPALPATVKPYPPSEIQVPKMKFGKVEIGRVVCGINQFYGFAHFNSILSGLMKDWYTQERVCDVLHRCNRYGINAYQFGLVTRSQQDLEKFREQGGKMHLICTGHADPVPNFRAVQPVAMYCHGEYVDRLYQQGELDQVREWCKKVRGLGPMGGVGRNRRGAIAPLEGQAGGAHF
jgi:hypothetical protein